MFFRRRRSRSLSSRRKKSLLRSRSAAEILEPRAMLAVFTVTTDEDSLPGNPSIAGSLRWAIEQANADPTFDTIAFNIATLPGQTDVTIQPNYALPAITQTARINGATQATEPSMHALQRPVVELRGRADEPGAAPNVDGLRVVGDNVEITGLAITRFTGAGIRITGSGANVFGNYIGTAREGASDLGNLGAGIVIASTSSTTLPIRIGGQTIAAPLGSFPGRNVISGNDGDGITIVDTPFVTITDSLVGTTAAGIGTPGSTIGNEGDGIKISGLRSYQIAIDGDNGLRTNVISANVGNGIHVLPDTPQVLIIDNIIGLSLDGTEVAGNQLNGLLLEGFDAEVRNNTISGNQGNGVLINGQSDPDQFRYGISNWITGDSSNGTLISPDDDRTYFSNTQLVPAMVGRGISFNGIDSLVLPGGGTSLPSDFDPTFSVEFWASFASLQGEQVLAEKLFQKNDGSINGWSFFKGADNSLRVLSTGGQLLTTAPGVVQANQFYHMALTREASGKVSIYLDGLLTASASLDPATNWTAYEVRLKLGYRAEIDHIETSDSNWPAGRGSRFFRGVMDEVTFYTEALAAAKVAAIHASMAQGKPKPAMANRLLDNRVGTDVTGTFGLGNLGDGIRLTGDTRTPLLQQGLSSGNGGAGLRIAITPQADPRPRRRSSNWGTWIEGTNVGLSQNRQAAIPNRTGIRIETDYDTTQLRSYTDFFPAQVPTIISGNLEDGLSIGPFAASVQVHQSLIGVNGTGTSPIGNGRIGVVVEPGDATLLAKGISVWQSTISGNRAGGIRLSEGTLQSDTESVAEYFRIEQNRIGTDITGSKSIGNGPYGILIDSQTDWSPSQSLQYFDGVLEGNTVSGNDTGIWFLDSRRFWNFHQNRIGTDPDGTFAIPNVTGIRIEDSSTVFIGNDPFKSPNIISGNTSDGVLVISSHDTPSSMVAEISGFIGTDVSGTVAIPNGTGVSIQATPSDPVDGFDQAFQVRIENAVISGNLGYGVEIVGEIRNAENNSYMSVRGSRIGTDKDGLAAIPNGLGGILITSDVLQVALDSNIVAFNSGSGVRHTGVASGGRNLTLLGANRFWGNSDLAIDLGETGPSDLESPASNVPGPPVLSSARIIDGEVEILGINPLEGGYAIQFYATRPTVSGTGQGEFQLGEAAILDVLAVAEPPYEDLDSRADHFAFRIPAPEGFGAGTLLTGVFVDARSLSYYGFLGLSEFSNIIPIDSVLSSLAPVVDAGGSIQLFAGDSLSRTVSFRDEDSNAFEVLVDYGDGSGKQPLDYRRDNRTMLLDHVYKKAGAYAVTVSVLDDSTPAGRLGTDSFQVVVQNTPPEIAFNEVQLTKRIREGETVNLTGAFADLGAEDGHTIEVDWGDGTAVTPEPIASGARSFALNHRYDDDGVSRADAHVYRVVVTVRDEFGAASATPVFLVEVDNVAPSNLQLAPDQSSLAEGETVTLTGSFVDPGLLDTHLVYVDWGDGSPKVKVPLDQIVQTGSLREFSLAHTYLDNPVDAAAYTVTVEVADDDDPLNPVSSTLQIAVSNQLPYFNETGIGQPPIFLSDDEINEGNSIAAFVQFLDQGTEPHTARVNWGDGTPETVLELPARGSTTFLPFINHRYEQNGEFAITVTVSDRDTPPGSEAETSRSITVRNVAPVVLPVTVAPAGPVNEGDEISISGFFTDPAADEPFSVVITWGDGTSSSAELDRATRSYTAKHRYLDDPIAVNDQYSITVSINDGVQTGTRTLSTVVRNVAPELNLLPIVDTSTSHPVFRAVGQDISPSDQTGLSYSWTLTKNGVSVPFVTRSANEIELDPAGIPSGSAPLILTSTVDDGDGGVSVATSVIVLGTSASDLMTIVDTSFPVGQTSIIVLGLGGDDVLDASGITATGLHVILYGGGGDDLLFDGAGSDVAVLGAGNDSLNLPASDPRNTLGIMPNMGGDDEVYLIPNSTLTAYDNLGLNTLNFSLASSAVTQANGITFDLELTQRSGIIAQDVAPGSAEPNEHFVAALGTFNKLVGSHYADKFTGASNTTVLGGLGADRFFTKDDIVDVTFGGGADADVLTARGRRVARVRFNGDDGADELHVDEFAEVLDDLDFDGGNDADIFINRGRVSRVIFKGGADADILQNQRGRISRIRFQGDDGIDTFINEEIASIEWLDGDDLTLQAEQGIDFDGGSDADVLINRGRVSRVVFKGGADADILQNQRGRISRIRFQGDDGIDTFINDEIASIEWLAGDDPALQADQGIDFDGGSDADVLINRGRVSRVVFKGGADADVLRNQKGRISRIRFQGDDGEDRLINDEFDEGASIEWLPGDDPALQAEQGIDFDGGSDADILINRGRVSRVVFKGGADADVLQNQRGRISRIRFQGDDGVDRFINEEFASIEWLAGDDAMLRTDQGIDFDGGNDADILINRGRVSRVVFRGGADADVLQNQRGRISRIRFQGDEGDDVLFNDELATIEWQIGDDPDLQFEQGIDFDGGDDADILINRGRVSRVVFRGGADADVLQNRKGRITKIRFAGDDGADTLINEEFATVAWETGDAPDLEVDQGVDFEGGADADVLINRGRVSRVVFRGGADSDLLDLQSGEVTDNVFFEGGDDADVLIARSRAGRIRFNGDGGADEFLITGIVAGAGVDDGLVEFFGGADADLLVTRGTLRRLVFRGGADDEADDVLQTVGGAIEELDFLSESGTGILVNRTNDIGTISFTGSNDGNMFINRGQNIGQITFFGAGGDDVFVNSGSAKQGSQGILRFDTGDGSNAMRNEGTGWAEVIYTGGLGADFLQNNGGDLGLISFAGGLGSNAVENNASGISGIVVEGSDDDDIFANDGDNVSGIAFHALNGNNTLINTGSNVSGIDFDGGIDADRFINSGAGLNNSVFNGNAGTDRLYNYGAETNDVTMVGGAGVDWWINQASAVGGQKLRFEAGTEDDSGDVFINWAANVSDVTFEGGVGDDLLQNGGLNDTSFQFKGGAGNDLFLNLGYGASLFSFDAGDGDDIFENRGRSGGKLQMLGGNGDDSFYQNAGFALDIELDGGDGDDTVLNFSSNMGRVALIGGRGTDILQSSGDDIGSLEVTGGDGKNTLQNYGHRVGSIRMQGSGSFAGAFDTLLNSGSTIGLIEVTSDVPVTVISSGNNIAVVSVIGSSFNDVLRLSGNNIGSTTFVGNNGDDSLLLDTQSDQSSSVVFHGDAGDDLFLFRGFTSSVLFEGGANDDQVMFAGIVNSATLRGNSGDDLYRFAEFTTGSVTIDEEYSRTLMTDDTSRDSLDFSSYRTGVVSLDLSLVTPQIQWAYFVPLVITLTDSRGIEDIVGTSKADTILGNSRNNMLAGAQYLRANISTGTPVSRTKTQWVYLDFGSHDDPGEFIYTEAMALEVKFRIEQAYAGFDVRFVLNTADLPVEIRDDSSKFATLYFNQTPSTGRPGGEASEIDFGNVNPGGFGTVQINGMLGGREVLESGLRAVAAASATADGDLIQAPDLPKPAATVENFIALSAKLGAHELGHLLGLRHYDAFGPVGFGIHSPPGLDVFKPVYAGIAAAFETTDHIISSPASIGSTRFNDLRQLYFGQREAIKLALAFSDESLVRTNELVAPHTTQSTAQPLGLVTLAVPNLATSGVNKDKLFLVQATSVMGSIGLAGATSESDWYSFAGAAGDMVTIEIMSQALKRYYASHTSSIDSVLRLYNAAGQLVQTYGTDAVNDDEFESSDSLLMDVTLPADGSYFIEVDTFRRDVGDASYDAAIALRDELELRRTDDAPGNDLSPAELQFLARLNDSLNDADTGSYELLIYRSSSINAADGIDILQGREGVDVLTGGEGDDYSIGVELSGMAEANADSDWTGQFLFTDRGGFSWTATADYGDGSAPAIWSLADNDRGQPLELSHVYAAAGDYVVTVTLRNDDGLEETQMRAVQIHPELPTDQLIGFDVSSGMTQRSWINSLDMVFSSEEMAADLMVASQRVRLTRFGLNGPGSDGSGGTSISYGGVAGLSRIGSTLKLNFGQRVIATTGRNSTAADGYYRLELDYNGDGVFDTAVYFYRLLGDVNGDRKVDASDRAGIMAALRNQNPEADANGDGVVNSADLTVVTRAIGRKLRDDLFTND